MDFALGAFQRADIGPDGPIAADFRPLSVAEALGAQLVLTRKSCGTRTGHEVALAGHRKGPQGLVPASVGNSQLNSVPFSEGNSECIGKVLSTLGPGPEGSASGHPE